jgi:hypothetical protein
VPVRFTRTAATYGTANLTASIPTGSGGVLVMVVIAHNAGTFALNTPGDWNDLGVPGGGNSAEIANAYWTTAESPDMRVNATGSTEWGLYVLRIPDADTSSPVVAFAASSGDSATTFDLPDVSPAPNGTAICISGSNDNRTHSSTSLGFVELYDGSIGGSGWYATTCMVGYLEGVTPGGGTFDAGTVTLSAIDYAWRGLTIVVKATTNTVATDDFNRANGGLGTNWTDAVAGLRIQSNAVDVNTPTDTQTFAYWNGGTFDDDQWAEVDVTPGGGGDGSSGPAVRMDANGNCYLAVCDEFAGNRHELYRVSDNGTTFTQLASIATNTGTGLRLLRVEATGTTISVFADGIEVISVTNSVLTTGRPGISIYRGSGNPSAVLDNFSAGDWIPPASNVPQNLVATTVDDDSIDLDWDAVTGADAYVVERDDSPWVVLDDNVLTNSYTDTGLDPSTEYTYRVRSVT